MIRHPHKERYPLVPGLTEATLKGAWENDPELKQLNIKLKAVRQKIQSRVDSLNGIIARCRNHIRHYRRNDPQMRRTVNNIKRRREIVYKQMMAYITARDRKKLQSAFSSWPEGARFAGEPKAKPSNQNRHRENETPKEG